MVPITETPIPLDVRVSFVIESGNDNKLIKTYVNGVLSGIAQYDNSDNFQQGTPVGITLNEGKEEYTFVAAGIILLYSIIWLITRTILSKKY